MRIRSERLRRFPVVIEQLVDLVGEDEKIELLGQFDEARPERFMPKKKGTIALPLEKDEIIKDYRLAYQSRQASLIGRREVLSGKAKFGIFGDGKEIAQLAIARAFKKGDWRSGYYRDQTWMFMLGVMSIQEFFAQLYAHADVTYDPASAGGR
jgi:TPP-dependent pyruvate/acetoin dehydrogenase alpha subunit